MASRFNEFPSVSKSEWLDKVVRDLKGKSIEELNHDWTSHFQLSPFFTQEDSADVSPLPARLANTWEIGNKVRIQDPVAANKILLDELLYGVNAPRLIFSDHLSSEDWQRVLDEVEPSFISLYLYPETRGDNPAIWLDPVLNELSRKGTAPADRRGAIRFSETEMPKVLEHWKLYQEALPNMKKLYIDNTSNYKEQEPEEELALGAYMAFYRLQEAVSKGVDVKEANENLHVSFAIGTSFFKDLAKLRAFKILWANLLQAASLDLDTPPFLNVEFAPYSADSDKHSNMIRATSQAMSGILGGADRLEVATANSTAVEEDPFTRRVARNLQHVLSMEAHLDQVDDPAAGSYFIETLSRKLAEKAFDLFKGMKPPF